MVRWMKQAVLCIVSTKLIVILYISECSNSYGVDVSAKHVFMILSPKILFFFEKEYDQEED